MTPDILEPGTLYPLKWYTPTPASDPIPCVWGGWFAFSASTGLQWYEVTAYGC